ncbi:hypothetical protein ABVK25_011186 [Lepraria finkii]|uniref:Uncharacterized protein n=1 Tax=Lepraria finkii TaxID=1340010 RepID=A0ABR4ASW5_9LECA
MAAPRGHPGLHPRGDLPMTGPLAFKNVNQIAHHITIGVNLRATTDRHHQTQGPAGTVMAQDLDQNYQMITRVGIIPKKNRQSYTPPSPD